MNLSSVHTYIQLPDVVVVVVVVLIVLVLLLVECTTTYSFD